MSENLKDTQGDGELKFSCGLYGVVGYGTLTIYYNENKVVFRSHFTKKEVVINTADIRKLESKAIYKLNPSVIIITTSTEEFIFHSFLLKDLAFSWLKSVLSKNQEMDNYVEVNRREDGSNLLVQGGRERTELRTASDLEGQSSLIASEDPNRSWHVVLNEHYPIPYGEMVDVLLADENNAITSEPTENSLSKKLRRIFLLEYIGVQSLYFSGWNREERNGRVVGSTRNIEYNVDVPLSGFLRTFITEEIKTFNQSTLCIDAFSKTLDAPFGEKFEVISRTEEQTATVTKGVKPKVVEHYANFQTALADYMRRTGTVRGHSERKVSNTTVAHDIAYQNLKVKQTNRNFDFEPNFMEKCVSQCNPWSISLSSFILMFSVLFTVYAMIYILILVHEMVGILSIIHESAVKNA
ncbi:hypothetical protein HK098_004448 [Nowakowskiella sp. JEL0407]|nr:hypothetical protein HK098_004448 [Nowakowskiella sp. JEL0407]